jgi:membrane protease YdiL (CAAX protease family)
LPVDLPLRVFQIIASFVGLALPPFLVTAATDGRAGVQGLFRRCLRWRVGLHWYLLALFGMLIGVLILALPFFGIAPLQRLATHGELLVSLVLPGVLIPFLLINLPEELAWAGFLQARLQERHSPVLASLLTAPAFALVHLPPFFVDGWINEEGSSLAEFPSVLLTVAFLAAFAIFFRIVMAWLYNGSGGSLLIVALFHTTFNLINSQQLMPQLIPDPSAVGLLPLGFIIVLAMLVTVASRGRLGYRPQLVEALSVASR